MSRCAERIVHYHQYDEPLDLTGKDLISRLDGTKDDVSAVIGGLLAKSEMAMLPLPLEVVTAMSGEIADEVHEWPNATLGTEFRHLVLQLLDDRLLGFRWSCPALLAKRPVQKNPWWKFW